LFLSKKWELSDGKLHVQFTAKEYAEVVPDRLIDIIVAKIEEESWLIQYIVDLHNRSLQPTEKKLTTYPKWYEDTRHIGCWYYRLDEDGLLSGYYRDGKPFPGKWTMNEIGSDHLIELPDEPEAVRAYRWPRWFEFHADGLIQYISFDSENDSPHKYTARGRPVNMNLFASLTYPQTVISSEWTRIQGEPEVVCKYRKLY
jgi:hypothetical protein